MSFNPNEPCVLGVEWFPPFEDAPKLDGPRAGEIIIMDSTAAASSAQLWVNFANKAFDPTICVDVYEIDTYEEAERTTGIHRPDTDVRIVDAYGWGPFAPGSTDSDVYRAIDGATLTPGVWPNSGQDVTNNEFIHSIFGAGYDVRFRFASIAGAYTGRIVGVTLKARVNLFVWDEIVKGQRVTPYLRIDGAEYRGDASPFLSGVARSGHLVTATWPFNPATGGPWEIADIEAFDTGDSSAGWVVDPTGSSNNLATIMQGWMEITETSADNRVASGIFREVSGDLVEEERGWNRVHWTIPWNKAAGQQYVLHIYRSSGSGSCSLRRLIARPDEPGSHNDHYVAKPIYFERSDLLADIDDTVKPGGAAALIVTDNAGVPTADSQPYVSVNGDANLDCGGVDNYWPSMVNNGFHQLVTPGSNGTYGFLRALIRHNGEPTEGLDVSIKRESDDLLMSSTETIDPESLRKPRTGAQGWQIVEVEFATPAVLVSGTQYYIDFVGEPTWEVQVLSCGLINQGRPCGPPDGAEDVKWHGAADPLRIATIDRDQLTACATLHINGPALGSFTVTETTAATLPGVAACLRYALVEWTVPAVTGCDAEYVEIQRSDDGGGTWFTIAEDYSLVEEGSFADYESKRNVASIYRGRLRLVGGGIGTMSAEESVTIGHPCVGLILASNLLPDLAAFYIDVGGEREYVPVANVIEYQFENRDFAIEVHDLANKGDKFEARLVVGASDVAGPDAVGRGDMGVRPVTGGRAEFEDLLASVSPSRGAAVPYVAVMDEKGNRWFASIRVPSGLIRMDAIYTTDVQVREVTNTPYIVRIV